MARTRYRRRGRYRGPFEPPPIPPTPLDMPVVARVAIVAGLAALYVAMLAIVP